MTDWEELDHVLTYVWNTPARPGSNIRRSQLEYGKTRAHEVVTAMLAEARAEGRVEGASCEGCQCAAEHDGDYGSGGHPGACPPHNHRDTTGGPTHDHP